MLVPRLKGLLSRNKSLHTSFRRYISNEELNQRVLVRFDRIVKDTESVHSWYPHYRIRFDEVVSEINKNRDEAYKYEAFVTALDVIMSTDEEVLGYRQQLRDKYGEEPKIKKISFYWAFGVSFLAGTIGAGLWWMWCSKHHKKMRDFKVQYKSFLEQERAEEAALKAAIADAATNELVVEEPAVDEAPEEPSAEIGGEPTLATA